MTTQIADMLGQDPMNSNLLDELAVNPQLLNAVLTPPIAFNPLFVDIAGSLTSGGHHGAPHTRGDDAFPGA